MKSSIMTSTLGVAIRQSLLACGLLLGLTGCPESDPSSPIGMPTLSASLIQRTYVKASNPDSGDEFGSKVVLDGDTLVVGAWKEDSSGGNGNQSGNSAADSGAVYVFQ